MRRNHIQQTAMALVLLFAAVTADRAAAAPYTPPAGTIEKPHLYEIRRGDKVSWLLGTIHRGVSLTELKSRLAVPLADSTQIVLEVVRPQRTAARERLWNADPIGAILTSPSYDFKSGLKLSIDDYEYLTKYADVPPRLARKLRSNSCAAYQAYFYQKTPEMETELERYARNHQRKLIAIDSNELRNAADKADGVPTDDEKNVACGLIDLVRMLTNPSHDTRIEKLISDYRSGHAPEEVTRPGHVLRNRAWVEGLRGLLEEGHTLVAVGAAHLYGEEGLLRLLAAEGYEIRRLP